MRRALGVRLRLEVMFFTAVQQGGTLKVRCGSGWCFIAVWRGGDAWGLISCDRRWPGPCEDASARMAFHCHSQ